MNTQTKTYEELINDALDQDLKSANVTDGEEIYGHELLMIQLIRELRLLREAVERGHVDDDLPVLDARRGTAL